MWMYPWKVISKNCKSNFFHLEKHWRKSRIQIRNRIWIHNPVVRIRGSGYQNVTNPEHFSISAMHLYILYASASLKCHSDTVCLSLHVMSLITLVHCAIYDSVILHHDCTTLYHHLFTSQSLSCSVVSPLHCMTLSWYHGHKYVSLASSHHTHITLHVLSSIFFQAFFSLQAVILSKLFFDVLCSLLPSVLPSKNLYAFSL